MTDRRRRGASWSSNCFQTSSAFGFLFFIFRSRVGIRGVGSPGGGGIFDRRLKVERKERVQGRGHREHRDNREKRKKQLPSSARDLLVRVRAGPGLQPAWPV